MSFKASNWESIKYPFGYFNTGSDTFSMYRNGSNEERYMLQSTASTNTSPATSLISSVIVKVQSCTLVNKKTIFTNELL